MKKFEYNTVNVKCKNFWRNQIDYKAFTVVLNEWGTKGWEAVSINFSNYFETSPRELTVIFKRELLHP